MSTDLARRPTHEDLPPAGVAESITQALDGLRAIRTFIKTEFDIGTKDRPGKDAGVIPGCGDKPTLFLPGAQKATMYFNAFPTYKVRESDLGGGHVEFRVRCLLVSRATDRQIGEGLGCASTMESKYRYRKAERTCPKCGKPCIINGKEEYGGGYLCFAKKGGCGAKFNRGNREIEGQATGLAENPDIHDVRNTVLKMAKKRAHVDAAMTLACLSELFTQDIEDTYPMAEVRASGRTEEPEPHHVDGEILEPPQKSAPGLFTRAHVEQTKMFNDWVAKKCKATNDAWLEDWEDRIAMALDNGLAAPAKIEDVINPWQSKAHLLKWAIESGRLADVKAEATRTRQTDAYVAAVFYRSDDDKAALKAEMGEYVREQRRVKSDAIYRENPDLAPDGWDAEQAEAAEPDRGDAYEGPDEAAEEALAN